MESSESLKKLVREKYGQIAEAEGCGSGCCCGVVDTAAPDYTIFAEDYTKLEGYNPDADLKLGCGVPTEYAQIERGATVLDLGSGAGNDAFVARALVGPSGRVIGVDMTPQMIERARINAQKLQYDNVEFRLGEIEQLPVEANSVDVVISNCVLNLVPDKKRAFAEIYRVLKPAGHFSISDVVLTQTLPEGLLKAAEMYAGCISGAMLRDSYLELVAAQGFENIRVQVEKSIDVPDDVLAKFIDPSEVQTLRGKGSPLRSITVHAEKPRKASSSCCGGSCC